jgi:hypothetical protein
MLSLTERDHEAECFDRGAKGLFAMPRIDWRAGVL